MDSIKISCKTSDYLAIDDIIPFQGRLKTRSKKDNDILAGYILDQGFSCPLFIWQHDGINSILDGHGRYYALLSLRDKGYHIPLIPVVFVEADSEREARLKILELNNMNGKFSVDAFRAYTEQLNLDFGSIHVHGLDCSQFYEKHLSLDSDVIDVDSTSISSSPIPNQSADVVCPYCSYSFSINVD